MYDDVVKPFIAPLYNVLLAPDVCYGLFPIIMLINLVHTGPFHKGFCTIFFSERSDITTHHIEKTCIFGKNEGKVKITKVNS